MKKGGKAQSFKPRDQVVAFSQRVADAVSVKDSEFVFAGYGVQAPEFQWDDFKGLDVKGKTLIVLVNDPPVADAGRSRRARREDLRRQGDDLLRPLDLQVREGRGTGRGGACSSCTRPRRPGYPFAVVQGFGGERFDLVTPDKNMGRAAIQGWLSLEAATALLKIGRAGLPGAEGAGAHARLQAGALGATASMSFTQ